MRSSVSNCLHNKAILEPITCLHSQGWVSHSADQVIRLASLPCPSCFRGGYRSSRHNFLAQLCPKLGGWEQSNFPRDYLDQRGKNPFTEPLQQVFPSISLARPAHLLISKPITWHRSAVTNDHSPSPEHLTAGQNQGNGQCVPHPGPPEPLHNRASSLLPILWFRQVQSLPPGMLLPPAPVHLEGAHSPGLT